MLGQPDTQNEQFSTSKYDSYAKQPIFEVRACLSVRTLGHLGLLMPELES
jgi:hypothetical protein